MHPCIFDLTTKHADLATCKNLDEKTPPPKDLDSNYEAMVEDIRKQIGFDTLRFLTLEEMIRAVIEAPNNTTLKREDLCLYCWTGCS